MIAAQVASGLAYINGPRHRIIHYDLKPANILFNSYGEVKITVLPPPAPHSYAHPAPPPVQQATPPRIVLLLLLLA